MPASSIHEALLDAVVARVQGLNLATSVPTLLPVQWRLALSRTWKANLTFPCVVISPHGTESPLTTGALDRDHTNLPFTVRVLDRAPLEDGARERELLGWRQAVRRALRNQPLAAAAGVWHVRYEASPAVEDLPPEYEMVSLPLTFTARIEEARG